MSNIEMTLAIINFIGTCFCTVLWHFIKKIELAAERGKDALAEYKLIVAKDYATDRDLQAVIEKCTASYNSVFNILESIRRDIRAVSDNFRDKLDMKKDKD